MQDDAVKQKKVEPDGLDDDDEISGEALGDNASGASPQNDPEASGQPATELLEISDLAARSSQKKEKKKRRAPVPEKQLDEVEAGYQNEQDEGDNEEEPADRDLDNAPPAMIGAYSQKRRVVVDDEAYDIGLDEEEEARARKRASKLRKRANRQPMQQEEQQEQDLQHNSYNDKYAEDEQHMFMDESAFDKVTSRHMSSVDTKSQISGCLFGVLGVIVLGFAIWLLKKGSESRRQEEVIEYAKNVKAWTDTYRNEFLKLSFAVRSASDPSTATPLPRVEGNMTAEWDISHALGRLGAKSTKPLNFQRYDQKLENDFYYRENKNIGNRRRLEDLDYYKDLPDDQLVIDYRPVKYELTYTPTKDDAFMATIYDLDHNKHYSNVNFTFSDSGSGAKDQLLQSHDFRLLHKEEKFSKTLDFCRRNKGRRVGTHLCLRYFLPSKICLVAEFAAPNQNSTLPSENLDPEKKRWQFQPKPCALQYKEPVADSGEFMQEIGFHSYPITVEIRSAHDPHVLFGEMTRGRFVLDNSASGQIAAGSVLLIFGILMLLMASYKTYRFCIKYTCREYFQQRRMQKYLESQKGAAALEGREEQLDDPHQL